MRNCLQCNKEIDEGPNDPPCCLIDDDGNIDPNGKPATWCSSECSEAWHAAKPSRSEGWVSLSDMTKEQINEEFKKVGLELEGVGERNPS